MVSVEDIVVEEVDLTVDVSSAGKLKMKQARLPFAPVNQADKKHAEGLSDKKRKLDVPSSPGLTKKVAKLDLAIPEQESPDAKNTSIKSKLAAFRSDQENSEKIEEEVAKENETPQPVKPRNAGASKVPEDRKSGSKDAKEKTESVGKFSGLLKLPFKKKEKKGSEKVLEKKGSDDDFLLEDQCAILELADVGTPVKEIGKEDSEEEDVSMTEKWASFHEENPEAVEPKVTKVKAKPKVAVKKKGPKDQPSEAGKEAIVAEHGKVKDSVGVGKKAPEKSKKAAKISEEVKKSMVEEKKTKEEEKKQKVDERKSKEDEKKLKEEEKKPKEGPLSKFFTKISSSKLTSEIPKADEDIEIVSMKKVGTPVRSSPRKNSNSISSPFDPAMVKAVAMSKLKVKVNELKMEMETAVAEQDFMKAHEVKQAIKKVEDEMKEGEETEMIDISNASVSSTPIRASPRKKQPLTPVVSRSVTKVSTPGSASPAISTGSPAPSNPFKKLSPGQLRKKEEAAKKREVLEAEKKAKKEEATKKKEEERLEKERKKEVEKRAKEVERKAKELEKEKEKKIKEEERDKKKLEKEMELKMKEEEKAKKEEEKRLLEAAEKDKLLKKAQAFKSFFKKEEVKEKEEKAEVEKTSGFFGILHTGKNMRLAPIVRGDPENARANIDSLEMPAGPDGLYLRLLQTKKHKPQAQGRTWPYVKKGDRVDDEDVTIVEEEDDEDGGDDGGVAIDIEMSQLLANMPRAKLLKFHENQRPAYWGTWASKTTKLIGPRRPFAKDVDHFEYDYDSDDDWEEEEEGEDLDEMDKEDQEEKEKDDYEVDNDFFVPHGYLSDGEEEKDEDEVFDPEAAKHKLKMREQEFEAEQKKKTKELKPRLWGCYWEESSMDAAANQLIRVLTGFSGIIDGNNNGPIETGFSKVESEDANENTEKAGEDTDSPDASGKKKGCKARPFLEEALPDLVRLVHRNPNSKNFLVKEFQKFWRSRGSEEEDVGTNLVDNISNRALVNKILEVATWTRQGMLWIVKDDVLEKVGMKADAPNEWKYQLEPSNVRNTEKQEKEVNCSATASPAPSPAASLITKFAKVMTAEEREERRVRLDKEAILAKEKREALKAEQLAKADHAKRMELKKQMEAKAKVAKESKLKKVHEIKTKVKPAQAPPKVLNRKSEKQSTLDMSSLPPGITITHIKNGDSPTIDKKIEALGPKAKPSPKRCLKANGPTTTVAVRKDLLKPNSPKIGIRNDLKKSNPSPLASKRTAPPVSSPIPCKTTYVTQSETLAPHGRFASPTNRPDVRRSSPRKAIVGNKPDVDCITIDDSN